MEKHKAFTPETITSLNSNEIFVFGSNEAGWHGGGAAWLAHQKFGALYGHGYGLQGQSFAIPTKDKNLNTLPLENIEKYIRSFIEFAGAFPQLKFLVTKIGCGLAGYDVKDIAPLFKKSTPLPANIVLPAEFAP